MKKLMYFFVGCIVIGFIGSLIISTLPAFKMAGSNFFSGIRQGNYQVPYAMFSRDFKQANDIERFKKFIVDKGLDQNKDVNWVKNVTDKDEEGGYIIGEAILRSGEKVPVEIHFIKEINPKTKTKGWVISEIYAGVDVVRRQSQQLVGPQK